MEVAANAAPPVCRIMDYGKFRFEQQKKQQEARKNQKRIQIKEIKFRPGTDEGDYQVKLRNLNRFLADGDKAKVTVRFRGREQSRPELGIRLLQRVAEETEDLGNIESHPRQDGRNMVMVLAPTRKKAEVKSDQRRRREEARAHRRAEKHAAKGARRGSRGARPADAS